MTDVVVSVVSFAIVIAVGGIVFPLEFGRSPQSYPPAKLLVLFMGGLGMIGLSLLLSDDPLVGIITLAEGHLDAKGVGIGYAMVLASVAGGVLTIRMRRKGRK